MNVSRPTSVPKACLRSLNIFAGNLAEISIYIFRCDGMDAIRVFVLEKMLPRQILTTPHDARDPPIGDGEAPDLTGLAAKLKPRLAFRECHMAIL